MVSRLVVTGVMCVGLAIEAGVSAQSGDKVTFDQIAGAWQTTMEGGRWVVTTDGKAPSTVFPLAAVREIPEVRAGRIRAEFKLISGAGDHTAGIVFGLGAEGKYHFGRYNTKDGNVAIWTFADGKRTVLSHGEAHKELARNVWHDISVSIQGQTVTVSAAKDTLKATHTFPAPIRGRIGFWTKADSVTAFRGLTVER